MEPNKELEKAIESKFLTPQKFAMEIEKIVAEEEFNYIDAICHYCEINGLEVESITRLISKPLKERLKWDATRLNFMKPTSRAKLPFIISKSELMHYRLQAIFVNIIILI